MTLSLPRHAMLIGASILLSGALASWGIHRLAEERRERATALAMVQIGSGARVPLAEAGAAFADKDRTRAAARFAETLHKEAAGHRLLVEKLVAASARPRLLEAEIALSGSEADIMRFTHAIESGRPAIRFANWRITRTAPGEATIRIEARALALWEPGA